MWDWDNPTFAVCEKLNNIESEFDCFLFLLNRYVAGKLKIVTNADAKGLNTYVGTFALPAIIFTSLVNLHWDTVNWLFLLAILISKFLVFFAVAIVTLLLSRPLDFGKAAILAIFCTQSNDFAIGAPIINALYDKNHKDYEAYLFLMAPLSLAILNPIGYVFLEWSNIRKNARRVCCDISSCGNHEILMIIIFICTYLYDPEWSS